MTDRRAKVDPDQLPDDSLGGRHYLVPDDVAHYFRDVLRLEPGDAVKLFDGRGRLLEGRIQVCRDDRVQLAIFDDQVVETNESPCRVTLCVSLPKRKRWRWILEKATELGVSRIVPLETAHSVIDIPDAKLERKLERWERILGEAARQCERTRTPRIAEPGAMSEALTGEFDGADFVLHARREAPSLVDRLEAFHQGASDHPHVRLWLGPEGGFSDDEVTQLTEADAAFCALGPRILRAETAAVVATTIVQARLGDLNQSSDSLRSGE